MPLNKTKTPDAFKSNVKKLIAEGYTQDQAVAIAYKTEGETHKPKSKTKKGTGHK